MEYIFMAVCIAIPIACMYFYRRGLKDGLGAKEGRIDRLKKPEILKTVEEKEKDKAEREYEKIAQEFENDLQALISFNGQKRGD